MTSALGRRPPKQREELLRDHHIEELLDAISALVDPPSTLT